MKVLQRVIPLERISEYKGTGANGDYVVGTWKVKGVVDGAMFAMKAFTLLDAALTDRINTEVDCEISIYGRDGTGNFLGRIFNEIDLKSIVGLETTSTSDLPQTAQQSSQVSNPLSVGANLPTDLPF